MTPEGSHGAHVARGYPVTVSELNRIHQFLLRTPVLSRFCTQNGWIDDDTLWFEIRDRDAQKLQVNVHFHEIIVKGAGCVANRVECFGRIAIRSCDNSFRVS
jgi:hypothetical protein